MTESVGANTLSFTVWGLFGGLAAVSRYRCEPADNGSELVTVGAEAMDLNFSIYEDERVTYAVHNGIATETSRTSITAPRDDPEFRYDAETCA